MIMMIFICFCFFLLFFFFLLPTPTTQALYIANERVYNYYVCIYFLQLIRITYSEPGRFQKQLQVVFRHSYEFLQLELQ